MLNSLAAGADRRWPRLFGDQRSVITRQFTTLLTTGDVDRCSAVFFATQE